MKNNMENQPENKVPDPVKRRGFMKAATLLGLGTMATGPFTSRATSTQRAENKNGIGTILMKKRTNTGG